MEILTSDKDWRGTDWSRHTRHIALDSGHRVNCVDVGTGDAPPLLLVHGLGASWQVWLENLLPLAADRRVVAVDLPGFGSSPPPAGDVTARAYAEVLRGFARAVGLGEFVAVGNSFGGWICAELALLEPAVVGLVLVDAVGMPQTRAERVRLTAMMRVLGRTAGLSARYRQQIAARPALRRRAFGLLLTYPEALPADLALQLLPARPSPVFARVLATAPQLLDRGWSRGLATLTTPTLIVWGAEDKQLPVRHALEWHRRLPGSLLQIFPSTGHVPMLERPDSFNAAVRRFLTTIPTRRP